jgi:DNA-directed RNA polymerase delta subunit
MSRADPSVLYRHIAGTKWGLRQYLKMDRFEEEIKEAAA